MSTPSLHSTFATFEVGELLELPALLDCVLDELEATLELEELEMILELEELELLEELAAWKVIGIPKLVMMKVPSAFFSRTSAQMKAEPGVTRFKAEAGYTYGADASSASPSSD